MVDSTSGLIHKIDVAPKKDKSVCRKIADQIRNVANGASQKLSEDDFLLALEKTEFHLITEAFDRIYDSDDVTDKLKRLEEHGYFCCSLITPSIKIDAQLTDKLELLENATNIKLALKSASLFERLLKTLADEQKQKLRQSKVI